LNNYLKNYSDSSVNGAAVPNFALLTRFTPIYQYFLLRFRESLGGFSQKLFMQIENFGLHYILHF